MRLTVSQIRILMLILNILLALGVPAYAVYGYLRSGQSQDSLVIVDLGSLRPGQGGISVSRPDSTSQMQAVASKLQPRPPAPPPPLPTAVDTASAIKEPESSEDDVYDGPGPLGDQGWVYHSYILQADPLNTFVILKKTDPAAAAGAPPSPATPSSRVSSRLRSTANVRSSRTTRTPGVRVQGPQDQISFHIGDREYKNDELGLHFYAHKADRSHFVYWVPDDPRLYALEFKHESPYDEDPRKGLRPRPTEPAQVASAAEGGEEKKESLIKVYKTGEYKDFTETDYEERLKQNKISAAGEPSRGTRPGSGSRARTIAPSAPPPRPAGPGSIERRPPGPPTAEEKQKLKEALQSIPKEKQAELMEGLKGVKLD